MPFGTRRLEGGGVCFRLWAPSAQSVRLWCDSGAGEVTLAMEDQGGGWYQVEAPQAHQGSRYGFIIDDNLRVPDPASRYNPADVHGPSQVVDPRAFAWRDGHWRGRSWEEAVIYELHVGTFTAQGTFAAAVERLDHLVELGVTAIELLPVADFPGARGWGYDGVLPYAPDSRYGTPEDLKELVQSAHDRGLMVLLDVVYNHFGPEGNYLHAYAEEFFTERHHTPWGAGLNFDGDASRPVREFFIHNALYWLEEFHFDGLRLDAVHAILDDSQPHFLEELARRVDEGPGRQRPIHLVLENEDNRASLLERDEQGQPLHYRAQWNDDFHNALHVQLTGETDGYYKAFSD
ncbi:MAG: alpha-amylase family glycosyl hydrolase, partial [Candidatus Competibacteraceae bacterium]|nr:alpha-amylase family glycosyl hydrolase [Candidatus Competibacteraceae bacterium]